MPSFIILGRPDCPNFVHALYVSEYLELKLPDFKYKTIQKLDDDLQEEIERVSRENNWILSELDTPVIWKEIYNVSGTVHKSLIGGLGEFWEYCYDYYGLESSMSKEDLEKLTKQNMEIYMKQLNTGPSFKVIVGIIGSNSQQLQFVIEELPKALNLQPEEIHVRILVDNLKYHKNVYDHILETDSFQDLLEDCQLLIILEDYSHKHNESQMKWLHRITLLLKILADMINTYANHDLKIILCHQGSTCLTGTILMAYCTSIRLKNIVSVTADYGLQAVNRLSEITNVPIMKMGGPPVWGWPGVANFNDLKSIIVKADIITPFGRSFQSVHQYTLPEAKIDHELRFSKYLINDDVENEVKYKINLTKKALRHDPIYGKARSLLSLIKLWYSNDQDTVISLGICSDGSFGLPTGVIISQPVTLNKKNVWQPFNHCFISEETKRNIEGIIEPIRRVLCMTGVPNHLCNCKICVDSRDK